MTAPRLLTYFDVIVPEYTMYCLNGAGQFETLKRFIEDKEVLYYGDTDKNGNDIAGQIPNLSDKRLLYIWYKDMNDYLMSL